MNFPLLADRGVREINKIIACSTVKTEIQAFAPDDLEMEFLEYGLHRHPHNLQKTLQEKVDENSGPWDYLLLGYGLCSHGTLGLKSKTKKLVIPKAHDCIALLLGSRERYTEEFFKQPGTIYLSRGWIEHGGDPLTQFEDYKERVGEENARWAMEVEYKNYKRLVFVKTPGTGNPEKYIDYSRRVAEFLGLDLIITEGSAELLRKLVVGQWDKDFLIVEPGRMVLRENLF